MGRINSLLGCRFMPESFGWQCCKLLTHRIKTPVAHVFSAQLATEYIANSALIVKNQVYRARIRVKVMDFAAHANQLAAAFVFPPLPTHAQLAVFDAPLPGITAAAVVTALPYIVPLSLNCREGVPPARRVAESLLPLMKAVASSVVRGTPAASVCAHHGAFFTSPRTASSAPSVASCSVILGDRRTDPN